MRLSVEITNAIWYDLIRLDLNMIRKESLPSVLRLSQCWLVEPCYSGQPSTKSIHALQGKHWAKPQEKQVWLVFILTRASVMKSISGSITCNLKLGVWLKMIIRLD